jgi:hypothetical protein
MLCNNIKVDLREIRWGGMDWLHLAENRDQLRAPVNMVSSIKCWEVLEWLHNWWPLKEYSAP